MPTPLSAKSIYPILFHFLWRFLTLGRSYACQKRCKKHTYGVAEASRHRFNSRKILWRRYKQIFIPPHGRDYLVGNNFLFPLCVTVFDIGKKFCMTNHCTKHAWCADEASRRCVDLRTALRKSLYPFNSRDCGVSCIYFVWRFWQGDEVLYDKNVCLVPSRLSKRPDAV